MRRLDRSAAFRLLTENTARRDEALSQSLRQAGMPHEAYPLAGGAVLLLVGTLPGRSPEGFRSPEDIAYADLADSRAELARLEQALAQSETPGEGWPEGLPIPFPWEGDDYLVCLDPYGAAFPDHVPGLIERMRFELVELGFADRDWEPDFSKGSLLCLDDHIHSTGPYGGKALLMPERFAQVVAYVGETYRRTVSGQWRVERDAERQAWQCDIMSRGEVAYPHLFLHIYDELHEKEYPSLHGFVDVQ
jgi:hypothetical protein